MRAVARKNQLKDKTEGKGQRPAVSDMKRSGIFHTALIIILLQLTLAMAGCRQGWFSSPSPGKQLEETGGSEKVPEQLISIESSIEKIIKTLDGPAIVEEEEGKEGQQQGQEESGDTSREGQEGGQGQQKQGGGGQSGGQEKGQEKKAPDPWKEIAPLINTLHFQWNSYVPMATKNGANMVLIENFSEALNDLSTTIMSKKKMDTLLSASRLYSFIPDFFSLYRTKTSPEIKRVRYYVRNAILSAMASNWNQAGNDSESLNSSWSIFKNTLSQKEQNLAAQVDFSIYEFKKVVSEKNMSLVDIKGRVLMSNIKELDKPGSESGSGASSH